MSGKTTRANGTNTKGANTKAPAVKPTTGATENTASNEGTQNESNNADAEAEGEKPAVSAPVVVKSKTIPLAGQNRKGGPTGPRLNADDPTYNVAVCEYNDLVKQGPKDGPKDFKFVPFILNGCWLPTFNGMEGLPVDSRPVYKTIEEAFAAEGIGAIGFGNTPMPTENLYTYAQNRNLAKNGYPTTVPTDAKEYTKYGCFITVTKANMPAVVANIKRFLESPYTVGSKALLELLPSPFALTYPAKVVAPTLTVAEAESAVA